MYGFHCSLIRPKTAHTNFISCGSQPADRCQPGRSDPAPSSLSVNSHHRVVTQATVSTHSGHRQCKLRPSSAQTQTIVNTNSGNRQYELRPPSVQTQATINANSGQSQYTLRPKSVHAQAEVSTNSSMDKLLHLPRSVSPPLSAGGLSPRAAT